MSGLLAQVGTDLVLPEVQYSVMMPWLVLVGGALILITLTSVIRLRPPAGSLAGFTVVFGLVSLVASGLLWNDVDDRGPSSAVGGAIVSDGFSVFFFVLVAVTVILAALLGDPYLRRERLDGPEYYALVMLSASGAMLMATANDLIVLFLGLEILSIALYVLAGFHSRRTESREAAMKYFVLGAFSSALFLYGIALVYGATGSTQLPEIAAFLADNVITANGVLLAGMALLLVGLGFKVAAVPFHTWTPDVYQGSPTPVTGFMAGAAKAGGFAGLLRIFFSTFDTLRLDWQPLVWGIAILTLVVGSVLAVVQNDIKRMLAYSSIAHAGYVLVGLQAANERGLSGALFYLLTYTFMIMGSFAVVLVVGRRGDAAHHLDDYRGLAGRRPLLALAFTVFLLAQAGIPLTSGFLAKFYVIGAAVESRSYALAIVAMLMSAVSGFFYLRVVVMMYMAPGDATDGATGGASDGGLAPDAGGRLTVPVAVGAAVVLTLAFTILVGTVLADPVFDFANRAVELF